MGAVSILVLVDIGLLYWGKGHTESERHLPEVLSLGDDNKISIKLRNHYRFSIQVELIDELPIQFQKRDFRLQFRMEPQEEKMSAFTLRPLERGSYEFGAINALLRSPLGLVTKRERHDNHFTIPVYPSVLQMRHLELQMWNRGGLFQGVKRLRRIGHSYEFEQIKQYTRGDDIRSINWKASSRRAELMVNQYEDEKSQQIYAIIDKGRSMKMPFNGLSLLDYSINSALAMANIALKKFDRAGMLTFSDQIEHIVKADQQPSQLRKIMLQLYNIRESQGESSFEVLYSAISHKIRVRSLLFLYTNFESIYALHRALPLLRRINSRHLLVVIFFENTELEDFSKGDAENIKGIYDKAIARKMLAEKEVIQSELVRHGIQAIKTQPEDLAINTLNKYLELKSKGLI